jgi:ABC-type bacteriocin/lantibiotic exporter with double-glycine peptidase domain
MSRRIRSNLFRHLIYQNIAFFDEEENSSGAITSKLAEDATQIQGLTGQLLGSILQSIAGLVVGLVIAFVNSWALTLVVFAALPLIMASGFIVIRSLSGFGAKIKKEYTKTAQMANEAIQNIRTVSTLTKEGYFYKRYVKGNDVPHQIAVKGAFISSLGFAASQAIIYLCYALAFWFGSRLILDGRNTNTEVL